MKRIIKISLIIIPLFFVIFQVVNNIVKAIIIEDKPIASASKAPLWINPYAKTTQLPWQKASFHIHSDNNTYTFERHSPENVYKVYKDNGFKIITISDYKTITKVLDDFIPAYEWGSTLNKRHLLAIGTDEVISDPFYLYARNTNIQWAIQELKRKNAFVVINHPNLFNSFKLEDLVLLKNYDALEIFTPYGGDNIDLMDKLLSEGKKVLCMASDDMHVLPDLMIKNIKEPWYKKIFRAISFIDARDSESLIRFVMLNTDSLQKNDVLSSLRTGNYICVRKYNKLFPDPKFGSIEFSGGIFSVNLPEKALRIEFIGEKGKLLKTFHGKKSGNYQLQKSDKFVRATIYTWEAIIVTNPIYNTKYIK